MGHLADGGGGGRFQGHASMHTLLTCGTSRASAIALNCCCKYCTQVANDRVKVNADDSLQQQPNIGSQLLCAARDWPK